jgi:osmotically-inducible protein OsmY
MRSEDRTREDVCERLTEHGQIDASNIEVTIENSDVTLNGTVDSLHAKRLAEDTAYSVPFVKEVNNRLRVAVASHSDA